MMTEKEMAKENRKFYIRLALWALGGVLTGYFAAELVEIAEGARFFITTATGLIAGFICILHTNFKSM